MSGTRQVPGRVGAGQVAKEELAWGSGVPKAHTHLTTFYKSPQVAFLHFPVKMSSGLDEIDSGAWMKHQEVNLGGMKETGKSG